jgi:hypothetical protein
MSDVRNLIRSNPPYKHSIGSISDGTLETMESFVDEIHILTLRLAQLKYNERVEKNKKDWWDDLGVFLGVPEHTVRDSNIVEFMTPIPFGLLNDVLEATGCNIPIAVEHDWNVYNEHHLLHTDVIEFSSYCLQQEEDLEEENGIFDNYLPDDWGVDKDELRRQIILEPHENLVKKKTLAVVEILSDRRSQKAVQVLKTVLEVLCQIGLNRLKFSELEKFVVFEREFLPDNDQYLIERKQLDQFTLKDIFDFGTEILELALYFDDDFDQFKENIQTFISNKSDEWFKSEHYELLEKVLTRE